MQGLPTGYSSSGGGGAPPVSGGEGVRERNRGRKQQQHRRGCGKVGDDELIEQAKNAAETAKQPPQRRAATHGGDGRSGTKRENRGREGRDGEEDNEREREMEVERGRRTGADRRGWSTILRIDRRRAAPPDRASQ
ncbi:hypothetical protein NL676_026723 [Syzygium grande]|nr:hypothetical protein NL676_026723 [Syzygium grande]